MIQARGLGKRYLLGETVRADLLRERITSGLRSLVRRSADQATSEGEEFWALRNIEFDVNEGEVLGVIGRNGAGKSTLLKILSRITEPTEGELRLRGRVASLLEVGTGFHKELTGRENVYLNGAILGMSRMEIRRKFDDIVSFAGVERFIDTPVKRYSSGMTVRLAFAVAAHLDPEILLIDEVLAVGDAEFQKRCLGKMDEVAKGGRTIIFVSHNMAAVEALCHRCALLSSGRLVSVGGVEQTVAAYLVSAESGAAGSADLHRHPGRPRHANAMMQYVVLCDENDVTTDTIRVHDALRIKVQFDAGTASFSPVLGYVLKNYLGAPVFTLDNRIIAGAEMPRVASGVICCEIPDVPLVPGRYTLDLYLGDRSRSLDTVLDAINFTVAPRDVFGTGRLPEAHHGSLVWSGRWWMDQSPVAAPRKVAAYP